MTRPTIKEYFKDKNIFITGGSGFMGKVIIEKLLRSCPHVGKIYILIRSKKGKNAQERIKEILESPLFDILKEKIPNVFEKVITINGDISVKDLGLSLKDKKTLIENVHLIIHNAASTGFHEPLIDAIRFNVWGAHQTALLALEMKKIEVFLHVSTAFCNVDQGNVIEEKLYPSRGNWKDALLLLEKCEDPQMLNALTYKYIGDFPNTYTYTKHLAEHCINDTLVGKISTVIFRPSLVSSSEGEPVPGWNEKYNGTIELSVAVGTGISRMGLGNINVFVDFVPVDSASKLAITALWHKGVTKNKNELDVYHGSNYNNERYPLRDLLLMLLSIFWLKPYQKRIWYPSIAHTTDRLCFLANVILFQVMPAIIFDGIRCVHSQKPFFLHLQRQLYTKSIALSYFKCNNFNFINTNELKLLESIPSVDKEEFDIKKFRHYDDYYEYEQNNVIGAKKFLLKESPDIKPETHRTTARLFYLDTAAKFVVFLFVLWLLFMMKIWLPTLF